MNRQQTIAREASLSGVGVHSGKPATLTVRAAGEGAGVLFKRADVTDRDAIIPALATKVTTTELGTNMSNEAGVSVATVEHFLAACSGLGIDNIIAELDGPELPILDGSSRPFVEMLDQAGVQEQSAPRRVLKILKPVEVRHGVKLARLSPGEGFEMRVIIDFPTRVIGRQQIRFAMTPGAFARDVAWARTFGFAHQAEQLHALGKGLGASMDNTIVVEGDAILNPGGLQADDEFVRHKLLDVIGDLFLAGGQIEGLYEGEQPGHALNNQLLRAVFADATSFAWT
ncbi:MAG TPA: UDP-3-O-acyl-N-acetylglucosamine deacetylase [Hyphomonadaceae bacterium]|nr:UDP-3-O-acyl-N-acetylglucosamine deacetylase [Hyphomonadaceae bacterium]HPN05248.1 UDP-3-O-acyl-N-acetylglucosamine deacetylase [Hyphomonadaceae bacterium]